MLAHVSAGLDASFESQERRSKIIGENAFEFILISSHSFTKSEFSFHVLLSAKSIHSSERLITLSHDSPKKSRPKFAQLFFLPVCIAG